MNKINKIVFCFSILLLCVSCGNQNETDDGTTSAIVTNDLIIDNETVVYNNEVVNVQGNVIIKNGGVLKIENNCQLNIIGTYDEQFSIIVSGDSKLESYDSIIQGIDYQIAIIGMAANGESPYLYFENTIITLHLGIRPLDQTIVESVNSNIEEIQLRDQSEVHISGGEEIYPVFFFENISGSLSNLKVYEKIQ